MNLACTYGESAWCQAECGELMAEWMQQTGNNNNNPFSGIWNTADVYCAGTKSVGEPAWEFMRQYYSEVQDETELDAVITALTCIEDGDLLGNTLLPLLESGEEFAEKADVFAERVAANPEGKDVIWQWLDEAWQGGLDDNDVSNKIEFKSSIFIFSMYIIGCSAIGGAIVQQVRLL